MPAFLQPDIQQIISQAISFLLLLVILRRFAWGPLLTILDQRRARIEGDLKHAADAKVEVARLREELDRRLAKIDEETRAKIQQAILEAKQISLQIQDEARTQGKAILAKSKETVELELAQAKVMLRDQVAEMTVQAVERVLKQKLDASADQRLIESILIDLEGTASRT
jgi:F-type H+-transporting ATPase subunit b